MRAFMTGLFVVLVSSTICAQEVLPKPTGAGLFGKRSQLELLFTRTRDIEGGLTEGPAVAPDGSIYFSDIALAEDKGMIMRFDPVSKKTTVFQADSKKSNGLIFDRQGRLLACEGSDHGGRCVARYDVKTGKREVLADKYQGKRFNAPNDLCLDAEGRIYFTDPRYLGDEPRELKFRSVYRLDTAGTVIEITPTVTKPNGIAISPDGKTLYVADHDNGTDKIDPDAPPPKEGDMKIHAFTLGVDGKVSGQGRVLVDFGEEKGCDGMTVDEAGNVYLTVRSSDRPGVRIINPSGKQVGEIPTGARGQKVEAPQSPTGLPSNVEFGIGKEKRVLYITVDTSLYRIKMRVKGHHFQYAK
jgi:gluconolactonase